ncbi:MAG: DNA polymerase III subunit delta [Candidatus Magasanikbacteria bacterium]|nr:DNA polymerase III subunit delta [Candidatus Magasanikbacteria bacterium]
MILFLYGADTLRSTQHRDKLIEKFKTDRDPQGYNVARVNALSESSGVFWQHVQSTPFLADKRLLVVENILISQWDDVQKELLQKIQEQTLPASTVIVFWEGSVPPKKKCAKELFTRLAGEPYAQEFALLTPIKLRGWIAREVTDLGGRISSEAVDYLAQNSREDMWLLSSVLAQIVSYADAREITLSDIQLFLAPKEDDNIFTLVDAVVEGQAVRVFSLIQEQYRQGKDVQYLFAMILRQFRILLEIRDVFEKEQSLDGVMIAKKLDLHPFVVKKSLGVVQKKTKQELERVYTALLQLDIDMKTGKADSKVLLDILVAELCVR